MNIVKLFIESGFRGEILRKINLNNNVDNNYLKEYVIKSKAWNDAMIRARFEPDYNNYSKNRDAIYRSIVERIEMMPSSEDKYRKWHKKTIEGLKNNYSIGYGVGQKLVNMSLKYICFLELEYKTVLFDNLDFANISYDLDVPIDSYILNWIKYVSADCSDDTNLLSRVQNWNSISEYDDYEELQRVIKSKLNESKHLDYNNILERETQIWINLKKLGL